MAMTCHGRLKLPARESRRCEKELVDDRDASEEERLCEVVDVAVIFVVYGAGWFFRKMQGLT